MHSTSQHYPAERQLTLLFDVKTAGLVTDGIRTLDQHKTENILINLLLQRAQFSVRTVHSSSRLTSCITAKPNLAHGPGRPVRFAAHRQPLCWNFMDHSRIVLSVGGSVWYMIRNLRCTVTIESPEVWHIPPGTSCIYTYSRR